MNEKEKPLWGSDMTNETDRNPGLDCYGMTPEQRAAYEDSLCEPISEVGKEGRYLDTYQHNEAHSFAEGWAACARQARERSIKQAVEYLALFGEVQEAFDRIKELEAEVERLRRCVTQTCCGTFAPPLTTL